MPRKKTYKDYEAAMERLEEITELLESGEAKLDDAIALYTEGLEIANFCNNKISEAEEKIKIIRQRQGLTTEENFEGVQE